METIDFITLNILLTLFGLSIVGLVAATLDRLNVAIAMIHVSFLVILLWVAVMNMWVES